MYVYGFLYESMYVRVCVRVYACIHAHSNRHAYIHTYIHTHTHTCICGCMHLQAQYFNVHAYTRIHMTSMLINLKKKTNKIFIWYSLVSIRAAVASLFRQVCGLLFIYIHELTTLYEGQLQLKFLLFFTATRQKAREALCVLVFIYTYRSL